MARKIQAGSDLEQRVACWYADAEVAPFTQELRSRGTTLSLLLFRTTFSLLEQFGQMEFCRRLGEVARSGADRHSTMATIRDRVRDVRWVGALDRHKLDLGDEDHARALALRGYAVLVAEMWSRCPLGVVRCWMAPEKAIEWIEKRVAEALPVPPFTPALRGVAYRQVRDQAGLLHKTPGWTASTVTEVQEFAASVDRRLGVPSDPSLLGQGSPEEIARAKTAESEAAARQMQDVFYAPPPASPSTMWDVAHAAGVGHLAERMHASNTPTTALVKGYRAGTWRRMAGGEARASTDPLELDRRRKRAENGHQPTEVLEGALRTSDDSDDDLPLDRPSREESPGDSSVMADVAAAVRRVIEASSDRTQRIVALKRSGLTWDEVAAEVGCGVTTARDDYTAVLEEARKLLRGGE